MNNALCIQTLESNKCLVGGFSILARIIAREFLAEHTGECPAEVINGDRNSE